MTNKDRFMARLRAKASIEPSAAFCVAMIEKGQAFLDEDEETGLILICPAETFDRFFIQE